MKTRRLNDLRLQFMTDFEDKTVRHRSQHSYYEGETEIIESE